MAQLVQLQFKQGLSTGSTGWAQINPVLATGEPGFEIDTGTLKVGDGSSPWIDLSNLRFGNSIALGQYAGQTGQNPAATSIGQHSGSLNQGIAATSIGSQAGNTNQGNYSVAVGPAAGQTSQGSSSVAIGSSSGQTGQGSYSVAIGSLSGSTNQGNNSLAFGSLSGVSNQGNSSIAIGTSSGSLYQGSNSVAVGPGSGQTSQGSYSIGIGILAGQTSQGTGSVAIGQYAGRTNQGANSIAIGGQAGHVIQAAQTIILNSTGSEINGVAGQTGSFYVAPVRNTSATLGSVPLCYNTSTSEIVASGLSGGVIVGSIYPSQDGQFDLGSTGARFRSIHALTASINTNTLKMSNVNGDNASISFHGGKFLFADHSSSSLMSIGPSGFNLENYTTFFGPNGILSGNYNTPSIYNILGLSVLDDSSTTTLIVDGGYPSYPYNFIADGNLNQVILY